MPGGRPREAVSAALPGDVGMALIQCARVADLCPSDSSWGHLQGRMGLSGDERLTRQEALQSPGALAQRDGSCVLS